MDPEAQKRSYEKLPYLVGGAFVLLFLVLCAWQISRGLDKKESQQQYDSQTGYIAWNDGMDVEAFQRLKVTGRYDSEHQFLLENIVRNAWQGYYVITPMIVREDEPVLLVNRGWMPKQQNLDLVALSVTDERLTASGRVGRLPRAGMKMGEAITAIGWPRKAVFPDYQDVAAALGREVQPFVLLLDAEDDFGFERDWQPVKFGPGRHYGYALQWFAMALMLAGLLAWNYRRRGFER